ncbi:hypothetical protein C7212DRAFT_359248 [Tuber magnatum]|uniref:BTB domain-containing protein n=1 Tax=Tuber magnatum TaxID=42249 RepID=A0A317SH79_9PEZI|nr:hypothetical protein C7212DRAFT_359248 [Tuber magnatum]
MSKSEAAKLSSKYKAFMFDGTVLLQVGRAEKIMKMHKNLLARISPELDKHVNNNMRGGIDGIIHFPDEGEVAFTLFAEWAYTGEYTIVDSTPLIRHSDHRGTCTVIKEDPWPSLRMHLELYAFSDKFNIPTLKLLAMSKFSKEIKPVEIKGKADTEGLTWVIAYAYDKLPDSDPIRKFLAQFTAWALTLLRGEDGFIQFTTTQPEFVKELLVNLGGLTTRPVLA